MPYTSNPFVPKLRASACRMIVQEGKSIREVSRYIGVHASTVSRWLEKYRIEDMRVIETTSSRPKSHPNSLSEDVVEAIVQKRKKHGRCAEVIHQELKNEGMVVSLSSVKRTLDRQGLTKKRSPWKRYHKPITRPYVAHPGDLIQVDTIHLMQDTKKRIYVYTLLDVYSRFAYAKASPRISAKRSVAFLGEAKTHSPFSFSCIQTDNGPEFSTHFTERIHITHRHSRVRKPNDNAHLERFNRTIQEECINQYPPEVDELNKHIPTFLAYYNTKRLHMGINFKTPIQMT